MARYTLNELRQMDEAKVLELWNTPQIDFAQRYGDPLMSYNDYAELKREGREEPNPCPMARKIAERRTNESL